MSPEEALGMSLVRARAGQYVFIDPSWKPWLSMSRHVLARRAFGWASVTLPLPGEHVVRVKSGRSHGLALNLFNRILSQGKK